MSLKLRFALLFSVTVAIILLISSAAVYYFYSTHRRQEYQNELQNEANVFYAAYKNHITNYDSAFSVSSTQQPLFRKLIAIYNGNRKQILSYPGTESFTVSNKTLANIKQRKEYYYKIGYREFVGLYDETQNMYIIASAMDRDGLNKLIRLRFILLGVFFGGVFASVAVSYFFVRSALKPLMQLKEEMKQTDIKNLTRRVYEGNGKDELSQIARRYNEMLDRLKRAFEIQKNFVHHASHELRTPLAVMFSTTESALNKNLSVDEYKDLLLSLKDDQNNLIELSNALLFLYQYEKQEENLNLATLRADEVLYEAVSYCKKMFPKVAVSIMFDDIAEEKYLTILGNETLLKSAFTNLIKNAFLYATNKSVQVLVSAANNQLHLHFDSLGEHLSDTEIENMKTPFARGENIGVVKGIGLGLSIVQKIVIIHNGNFIYTPIYPNTNRFSIVLPFLLEK